VVIDNCIRGTTSLSRLDLTRLKLFNTTTPATAPPPRVEAVTIPTDASNPKKSNKIPTIQLPGPIINFRSSAATGSLVCWSLDCFPLPGCDAPRFLLASLTLMTDSVESNRLTLVKPRSTWVITRKPREQSLMTLLIKSTHTCGQTLIKGTVKPH
jgi:hypothetical protein